MDFVTLYNTRPSPIMLPTPQTEEAKAAGLDQPGASGVEKDMLLPGANRVRRDFMAMIADNPSIKIWWKARILTFDPPADVRELGDLRRVMEERRVHAQETTGPSATVDNPFAGKQTAECLAIVATETDAAALSRWMEVDSRSEIRTAVIRRMAALGSAA